MALRFFSTHTHSASSSVKLFEIRLDNDYIVFRGSEDEAGSAQVAGEVALCVTDPLTISGINLTLSGIVHMSYQLSSTAAMSGRKSASKDKTFYEKTWALRDPGKGRSETLSPDNYVWPFSVVLDGTLPESVEGLKDAYIIYRLKAEIIRKRAKDIVVRKPLRVVRTLGPSALELSHAMSVDNIWPNKVEYSLSTPSKAVVFGSFLQVDFRLVPLLKGLTIGNIGVSLREEQEFVLDPEWGITSAINGGCTRDERLIAYDNFKISPDQDIQILEEAVEGYQFSRYLELPKSLTQCMQDCNVKGIKIRHKIKFNVQLHNPDGHVSELRANLPISLYISENLPLNADNDLVDQTPQAGRAAVENDMAHSAPPLYGEHQLDRLYSDVDQSGYQTPGGVLSSGSTPYSHSRNISSENLTNLNNLSNGGSPPGHVSAAALSNRLQDLRVSDRNIPRGITQNHDDPQQPRSGQISRRGSHQHTTSDYFSLSASADPGLPNQQSPDENRSGLSSRSDSNNISRQTSSEDERRNPSGPGTPYFSSRHMENLAKVPSYSTAVRTPAPRNIDSVSGLPSYTSAISASTSPSTRETLTEPPAAYIGSIRRDGQSVVTMATGGSHVNRSAPSQRTIRETQDEERRFRMLQARGRG